MTIENVQLSAEKLPTEVRISASVAVSLLAGVLLNAGMTYQQFQQLKDDQKTITTMVTILRESQIGEQVAGANARVEQQSQAGRIDRIDKRLLVIEGNLMGHKK